jgi:hypothetical protein
MSKENTTALRLERYAPAAALLGLIGLVVALIVIFSGGKSGQEMLYSYLFAYIFWGLLAFGCFGLSLLQHTVQAKWGLPVIRIFEAGGGTRMLMLFAILLVPIVYTVVTGNAVIYPWADPQNVANDHILQHRQPYMNPIFWTIRWLGFFALWMFWSNRMRQSTLRQDETKKFSEQQMRANWAAPGLVMFVLTMTFAFTDWIMSADVHWFSTMYGVWLIAGMGLAGLALVSLILGVNHRREPYAGVVTPRLTRDLGNLMLTFTMLWAYTSLSQYLIIWSGNLPEFTVYYVNRSQGWWNAIGAAAIVGQFFIPFVMLLSPRVKATPMLLARLAGWILVLRLIDTYQVVIPTFRHAAGQNLWMDALALVGVGGLWLYAFTSSLAKAPLLPTYDPRLLESEAHAH